jgi:FKBP-type peptidyl-prolyl cis-trans isomerase
MTRGARYRFIVPPELGHGEKGHQLVPPNATLYFEVELLDFQPGPKPPSFRQGNPAQQHTTGSGLVYEALLEGQGDAITETTNLEMHFACWNRQGELLHWSGASEPYVGNCSGFNLPFMSEAVQLMKQGALYRFEVPPELGIAEEGPTVWELQITATSPPTEAELTAPVFSMPPPEELTRTDSGLRYRVIRPGSGAAPTSESKLVLHFAGWLEDGTLIESTYLRQTPVSLKLHEVFTGFREGLRLMSPGAVYEFVIPPELAYGAEGKLPRIPSHATLIYRVELLSLEAQDA